MGSNFMVSLAPIITHFAYPHKSGKEEEGRGERLFLSQDVFSVSYFVFFVFGTINGLK